MRTALILAATLALAACQPDRQPPDPVASAGAEVAPAADASGNETAGSQYDPINRANAVEGDVIEQQQTQDKQMEEQGG